MVLFHRFYLVCNPAVRRGYIVQILARWRRPMALSEALDPLHRAKYVALHRRIGAAVETGCIGGAFICCRQFSFTNDHVMVH